MTKDAKTDKELIKEFEDAQKTKNEELHKMDLPQFDTLRGEQLRK